MRSDSARFPRAPDEALIEPDVLCRGRPRGAALAGGRGTGAFELTTTGNPLRASGDIRDRRALVRAPGHSSRPSRLRP